MVTRVKRKIGVFVCCFLLFILVVSAVTAERLPAVGGDSGSWGTVLNEFLNVSHNESGGLRSDVVLGSNIFLVNMDSLFADKETGSSGSKLQINGDFYITLSGGILIIDSDGSIKVGYKIE